jgi:exodeoxyribonuclease V gamma subunit
VLHIHRGERTDALVAALAEVMATPPDDPLASEVVAVPTRGVERWLTQRLATRLGASATGDGVCANVDFPFPGRLVGGVVAAACGVDPEDDPWRPERAVWPLLELVEGCRNEPWMAALATHLASSAAAGEVTHTRRFGVVRHLADLFDRYAVHRPGMVRAWADGDDVDADGVPLPADVAWQAALWRRLRQRLAVPSLAERVDDAAARLAAEPTAVALPQRVAAFGLTRLPASYLRVLSALATGREVHLFLLHPSPARWGELADATPSPAPAPRRGEAPAAVAARHPLLASWGRDAREMQLVLAASDAPRAEHHHRVAVEPTSLLSRLQADIHADRAPPGPPAPGEADQRSLLDPDDDSVQVHSCHGRARQVEVMRDAILHLLAADPTLEPRDVVIMCPDIEAFAPLIHAAFEASAVAVDTTGLPAAADAASAEAGNGGHGTKPHEPHRRAGGRRLPDLRLRLADRSLRQTNPVLRVVAELLDLADARLTGSQVLDLASREPVRRRFGFSDDELERLEGWVAGAGIRWGLDAAHRAAWKLDNVAANTWHAGLDRLLLGVAMSEEGQPLVGGALPYDDVAGGDIDLAGRAAELVDRLGQALAGLASPQPVAQATAAIAAAADALTATGEDEAWQRWQLAGLLDELVSEARPAPGAEPCATPLTLAELRALLADRLRGRPTRANFRTGHLTVCTLVPMRSVPHRVVGLLGLDDGAFPRQTAPDGDDLVDRDPHVGDRDARSEDRQLLLDALLAATDHLVVAYSGHDERTNIQRPPAVPVGELLDVADRTVRTGEAGAAGAPAAANQRICRDHPLQPFDPRNFQPGAIRAEGAWSFDPVMCDGAHAAVEAGGSAGSGQRGAAFLASPLAPPAGVTVELDDLVAFAVRPVRAFLRQRLGIALGGQRDEPADALPVELDGLARWRVGQRLLDARLAGVTEARAVAAERARGELPPGALAQPVLNRVLPAVRTLVAATTELVGAEPEPCPVDAGVVVDGTRLAGTVAAVTGDVVWQVSYARLGPGHRLAAWVRLLAATAAHPERPFEAVTLGRATPSHHDDGEAHASVARIPALAGDAAARADTARAHLADLVALHRRGLCEPLPLACATSHAYAAARAAGRDAGQARQAAATAWASAYLPGENADPEHELVLGPHAAFEAFEGLGATAGPERDTSAWSDDAAPGAASHEPTRCGRLSRVLWDPLLAREEVSRR